MVAGGAGYIGAVLTRRLLGEGYRVRVLDSLLYGNGESLSGIADHPGFEFIRGDVRSTEDVRTAIKGVSDVVLLAALVGDPVCKLNPELARDTNLNGARTVLDAASEGSVQRLVFASTCSNYGLSGEEALSEEDALNPLSLYAETKVEIEQDVISRAGSSDLAPTVMRVATAFGISARMRFDLTVSEFSRDLALGRALEVYDPDTWRPHCHVYDISSAIIDVLEANVADVGGEVFNVGGDDGNHTKRMIAEAALDVIDGKGEVAWTKGGADARNYRVSFAKIRDQLGFTPKRTVPWAIERLIAAVRSGLFPEVDSRPLYYRNFELRTAAGEGRGGGDAG